MVRALSVTHRGWEPLPYIPPFFGARPLSGSTNSHPPQNQLKALLLEETDYFYSAFLQDEFRLLPHGLVLTIGSKFEDNNTGFEIQPDVRLLWNPMTHASLWGAIRRAVRTPGRLDQDPQFTYVESTS